MAWPSLHHLRAPRSVRSWTCGTRPRSYASDVTDAIKKLQEAFQNPSSPFYLAPGEVGPASPEPLPDLTIRITNAEQASQEVCGYHVDAAIAIASASGDSAELTRITPKRHVVPLYPYSDPSYDGGRDGAMAYARRNGFALTNLVEWPVAWGETDQFRHINNTAYARYFETGRIKVMQSLADHLPEKDYNHMALATGMGFVIKSVLLKYVRPVTFPDSLVLMTKPAAIDQARASFTLDQVAWSLKQDALVAKCESLQVMYDFRTLKKGSMSDEFRSALDSIRNEA